MLLATWNLNNRVGKRKFRPETADAVIALNPDVMVFTEFFPKTHEDPFRRTLTDAGWSNQLISPEPPREEIANRVLIAAKAPLEPLDVELPTCDGQFPANLLCVRLPTWGISLVGARVPAYVTSPPIRDAWGWIEQTAGSLRDTPSVILGDLNVSMTSPRAKGGDHFRRIVSDGWHRAVPNGEGSYFGRNGIRTEIDHIIGTTHCKFSDVVYVQEAGGYTLVAEAGKAAISDHAVLMCRVSR